MGTSNIAATTRVVAGDELMLWSVPEKSEHLDTVACARPCDRARCASSMYAGTVGDVARSPLWLYANLALVACAATSSVAVDNHAPRRSSLLEDRTSLLEDRAGLLEGRVVDPETLEVVKFFPLVITPQGQATGMATSDALGHYRVKVPAGNVVVALYPGDPDAVSANVHVGQVTRLDVAVSGGPAALLDIGRLPTCPGSPLYARIEGHPAPQSEVDALAHAFLAAFASESMDGSFVAIELPGNRWLTTAALPTSRPAQFRLATTAAIHALADLRLGDVFYTRFDAIDSDGRCALVSVIRDQMRPSNYRGLITPHGFTALFELRGSDWILLTRVASWES
jgi:hypothetical protein